MGVGPLPAIRQALARTGQNIEKMDLFEVNEAFAPQVLVVINELGLPSERTNVDGGAIALGHPLGASGVRIVAHLLYERGRRKVRLGVGPPDLGAGRGLR